MPEEQRPEVGRQRPNLTRDEGKMVVMHPDDVPARSLADRRPAELQVAAHVISEEHVVEAALVEESVANGPENPVREAMVVVGGRRLAERQETE